VADDVPGTKNAPVSVAIVGVGRGEKNDDPEADVTARKAEGHRYTDNDVRDQKLDSAASTKYYQGFSKMRGLDCDLVDSIGKPVHLSVNYPRERKANYDIINFLPLFGFLEIILGKHNLKTPTSSRTPGRTVDEHNVHEAMQFDIVKEELQKELLEEVPDQGEAFIAAQPDTLHVSGGGY
jgi:hypothetical protein